mmetsp:Transcript_33670/g.38748  ORF Transcript_33670/g.38748 Transcript_33670/m.38748 type:complete len:377 (-) Transcript_33670:670-1800(-)
MKERPELEDHMGLYHSPKDSSIENQTSVYNLQSKSTSTTFDFNKFSNIMNCSYSRTPIQCIQNPIRARKGESNSQRNEFSEMSDDDLSNDDLFFIEEYFKNSSQKLLPCGQDVPIPQYGLNLSHSASQDGPNDRRCDLEKIVRKPREEESLYVVNLTKNCCSTPPLRAIETTHYEFISNGYKISKNKKPSGDAFFCSKLGIGVADGVGGWQAYGINPSSFSEKLMDECKLIIRDKEQRLSEIKRKSSKAKIDSNHNDSDFDDKTCSSNDKDYSEMEKAFGVKIRKNKLKRIRSSFHLDQKIIHNSENANSHEKAEKTSPQSNSEITERVYCKDIRIEPRTIMKDAFKKVDVFGSSTACISIIHDNILKVANLGDSK